MTNSVSRLVDGGFFQTPVFLALTLGVPFGIFKLLFGILALRSALENHVTYLVWFGYIAVVWASVDIIMSILTAIFGLAGHRSPIDYCTLAEMGSFLGRPGVYQAIDTLISFSIICFVLWSGWILNLNFIEARLWYAATTVNLISVALVALCAELRKEEERRCEANIDPL